MHHIHLDPLGGVAGDMFVAAMLHAFPDLAAETLRAAEQVSGARCALAPLSDGVLSGQRFTVAEHHDHHGGHAPGHGHGHAHWSSIRERILHAGLPEPAARHAVGIFTVLAEAEARVHGVDVEAVTFHEVGAADSIADIVAAAMLIAGIGPASWSTAPLPSGSGRVLTAHGVMPVPAPATALLLEGFVLEDDGFPGERVTPTGAAILRHLGAAAARSAGVLRASGLGFGTRRIPGISNCLRVLVSDALAPAGPEHRELAVIAFEVDDQSGEDLAAGLDRIRATPGVHDALQMAAIGKKGRMTVHVQVLARPDALDGVVEACFRQTTTIGLRTQLVAGRALPRRAASVAVQGQDLTVKLVDRPGCGTTGKAEADHLLHLDSHAARARLRRDAELQAEAV